MHNKGPLNPMVLCCNIYRALIVSKEPQKSLFWIRVFLKSPKAHLWGPKRHLRGPCYQLLARGGMGNQLQIMRMGAPQSLFSWGPELLSTALCMDSTSNGKTVNLLRLSSFSEIKGRRCSLVVHPQGHVWILPPTDRQ